jgi:fructoselysine transporter
LAEASLKRGLGLVQASAINMIDMVGIGPFVTISIIAGYMQGPQCMLAWLLGALLAFMDGFTWSELGAKYPEAGGSYVFLQKLYGEKKWGRLMAFLFTWQTSIQAPLVIASGAIGFSQYFCYLVKLADWQQRVMSGSLVLLIILILYRDIKSIGRISVLLWIITGGTILWVIFSGFVKFNPTNAFQWNHENLGLNTVFFTTLGNASLKSVYSFLGYYNVCHLGGEIIDPRRNIPRSIFISIAGITVLYLGMETMVVGVLDWKHVAASDFVISDYFEFLFGKKEAIIATVLVLTIAFASLFSVLLGYSRVPYAAALDGNFFKVFSRVHPRFHFPHISLLALGAVAFIFSLLFKMSGVITAIVTMRILIQFVSQAVGVIAWHYNKPADERPYKMPLFPLPAILSIIIWLFIFFSSDWEYILGALGVIVSGIIAFFLRLRWNKIVW